MPAAGPARRYFAALSTMESGYSDFGNLGDFPKGKTLTLPKAVPGLILINYKSCRCGLTVSAPVFLTHKRHKGLGSRLLCRMMEEPKKITCPNCSNVASA